MGIRGKEGSNYRNDSQNYDRTNLGNLHIENLLPVSDIVRGCYSGCESNSKSEKKKKTFCKIFVEVFLWLRCTKVLFYFISWFLFWGFSVNVQWTGNPVTLRTWSDMVHRTWGTTGSGYRPNKFRLVLLYK